jgi:plasmid stabilization system protein ParE
MKSYASSKTIIMEVVWSPLSLLRYEEIKIYLLENFGKDSSNEFSDKLLSSVDLIAQNSAVGKKINNDIRSLVVVKQISIHYQVTSQIEILTLWDNRRAPIF